MKQLFYCGLIVFAVGCYRKTEDFNYYESMKWYFVNADTLTRDTGSIWNVASFTLESFHWNPDSNAFLTTGNYVFEKFAHQSVFFKPGGSYSVTDTLAMRLNIPMTGTFQASNGRDPAWMTVEFNGNPKTSLNLRKSIWFDGNPPNSLYAFTKYYPSPTIENFIELVLIP